MTPLTLDPVTSMSNGTPRHRRQPSLRVTFADEYQGHVNCSVIYYCDVGDDVTVVKEDDCDMTSNAPLQSVKLLGETVKRSISTESHDNPFVLDGELQRKADFILQHSTISRNTLTIADPDQLRTVTETADHVRTITETADPGEVRLIPASVNHDQSVANGINYKADIHVISGKEREHEAEVLFADGFVSRRGGMESKSTVENRLGEDGETEFTVENHHLGGGNEIGFTVENRLGGSEETDFTVENRCVGEGVARTEEIPVRKTIEMDGVITEAERSRQCCRIQ